MVKRYGQDWEYEPSRIILRETGPYVLHSDYVVLKIALEVRISELEAENKAALSELETYRNSNNDFAKRIQLLETALLRAADEPNIDKARAIADDILMPKANAPAR